MRILLYAPGDDENGLRLEVLLGKLVPRGRVERFNTLGGLSRFLQNGLAEPQLAVLLVRNREDLLNIASFQQAFEGVQILLVLPDQEREMIGIAHQLRPRYVTCHSSEYSDLLAVIRQKVTPVHKVPLRQSGARPRKQPRRSRSR